jgi:hypothetical protein
MRTFLWTAATVLLAGCYQVGQMEGTQIEPITVEGRKFEIRMERTGAPNEWRLLVHRATMVIGPEAETEYDRARVVARRIMERTCKGQPYNQAIETMQGINYRTVFTCQPS